MCHKCFGVGFVQEELQNGTKLVHPCPVCDKSESDSRNRELRRLPGWISHRPGQAAAAEGAENHASDQDAPADEYVPNPAER